MKRLFYLEWLKNYSYKPVTIFSIIYIIFIILFLLLGLVEININGQEVSFVNQGFFNYPQVWNVITYFAASIKLFLGLIIIFTITQEFSHKLFKQNIIDGLSRKEYIVSKFLTIVSVSIISTLLVLIIGFTLATMYSEDSSSSVIFSEFYYIGGYWLKLITFFSFLLFLSILFRRSVFVILFLFVWWIAEGVLYLFEKYIRYKVNSDNLKENELGSDATFYFTDLLPLNAMSKLINSPIIRLFDNNVLMKEFQFSIPWVYIIVCILYIALFLYGSYYILKKKDW